MAATTDRNDPGLTEIMADGQQKNYLVLSKEERAKGFCRPVRTRYEHLKCGGITTMGAIIAETYARNPAFYTGTFCAHCGKHFNLRDQDGAPNFIWDEDGSLVGS